MVNRSEMNSSERKAAAQVCKVVWKYNGYTEDIPLMIGKSRLLCKWWVRCHLMDSQYAVGMFTIIPMET